MLIDYKKSLYIRTPPPPPPLNFGGSSTVNEV